MLVLEGGKVPLCVAQRCVLPLRAQRVCELEGVQLELKRGVGGRQGHAVLVGPVQRGGQVATLDLGGLGFRV